MRAKSQNAQKKQLAYRWPVTVGPKSKPAGACGCCCCGGGHEGDASGVYAPGMGTAAYCCSPGAAATWSFLLSWNAGDGIGGETVFVRAGASKPSCSTLGVAPVTLIGGAWRVKGWGWAISRAYAYCTLSLSPFSAAECGSTYIGWPGGGRQPPERGDIGPKPGVLGADWERS